MTSTLQEPKGDPRARPMSERTYIGPDAAKLEPEGHTAGHVSLATARRWSLERVEEIEAKVAELAADNTTRGEQLREAQRRSDLAGERLHQERARLVAAREDLAWRCEVGS